MFKKKDKEKVRGISSNNYSKLLFDVFFIHKNIKKIDFISNTMVSKVSIGGNVYQGNSNISFSEIKDIEGILKRADLIDMIYFYGTTKDVQVYKHEYSSHFVSDSFIEIHFKNGSTKKIIFS